MQGSAGTWTAFVGEPGRRTELSLTGTWVEARDALAAWLKDERAWMTEPDPANPGDPDPCPHCLGQVTDALARLEATPAESPYRDDFELDELHLTKVGDR